MQYLNTTMRTALCLTAKQKIGGSFSPCPRRPATENEEFANCPSLQCKAKGVTRLPRSLTVSKNYLWMERGNKQKLWCACEDLSALMTLYDNKELGLQQE